VNHIVLLVDLTFLLLEFVFELCDRFILLLKLVSFFVNDTFLALELDSDIVEFVLGGLQVGLGAQTHIHDLIQIGLVLHLHLVDFSIGIVVDLLHRLAVLVLHDADAFCQVLDLLVLLVDRVLMILLLLGDFTDMILVQLGLHLAEFARIDLELLLHCLVASSVFEHALRVVISASFKLLVVLLSLEPELLLELVLDLVFASDELLNLALHHEALAGELLSELLDLVNLVVGASLLAKARMRRVLRIIQIVHQLRLLVDSLVNLLLFR